MTKNIDVLKTDLKAQPHEEITKKVSDSFFTTLENFKTSFTNVNPDAFRGIGGI